MSAGPGSRDDRGRKTARLPAATGKARRRTEHAEQLRADVVCLALSMPVSGIARRLRVHRVTVSKILAEPDVEAQLAAARTTAFRDARAVLRKATLRAAHVLVELLEHEAGHVACRAAIEILSKAGADAPRQLDLGVLADATDKELWERLRAIQAGDENA